MTGLYNNRTWGRTQCNHYLRQLEQHCRGTADDLKRGRPGDEIRPGLRRSRVGRHVVFYREEAGGILFSRVPHERMLPEALGMEDEVEN